jgi:hypothetical protein
MSPEPWGQGTERPLMDKSVGSGFTGEVAFAVGLDK